MKKKPCLPGAQSLLLLALTLPARMPAAACEGTCMAAGSAAARRGEEVSIPVSGRSDVPIRGFSFALGHDASRSELLRIETGPLFADAELVSVTIENETGSRGPPHGALFVILDFQQPIDRLPVDVPGGTRLAAFVYSIPAVAEAGISPLLLRNRVYGPPHREVSAIYVDAANGEVYPGLADGEIEITAGPTSFLRGDCNGDGTLDISDPVFTLGYLFSGSSHPRCEDACDVHDDGEIDISDPIQALSFLFQGGPPPLPPHPGAGFDPTQDMLVCGD